MDYLFFVQYDASYSEEYVYIILSTTIKLNKYVEFQFFFILPGNAKSSKGTKFWVEKPSFNHKDQENEAIFLRKQLKYTTVWHNAMQ